jgi:RiboL-PSP-HEPN
MGKILELARSFDPEWADELEAVTIGKLKDAIDSIVANRHNIAHGQYTGITLAAIIDYYASAVKVLELIEGQCNT